MASSVLTTLTSNNSIFLSGFLSGLFTPVGFNKRTLEHPFSTLLDGCVLGSFTGFGSSVVGSFLPPQIKLIIPVLATASILYFKSIELLHLYKSGVL